MLYTIILARKKTIENTRDAENNAFVFVRFLKQPAAVFVVHKHVFYLWSNLVCLSKNPRLTKKTSQIKTHSENSTPHSRRIKN